MTLADGHTSPEDTPPHAGDQPSSSFHLERRLLSLRLRRARLVAREQLAPSYLRIRLEGADLAGFGADSGHDDHVRLFFPPSGGGATGGDGAVATSDGSSGELARWRSYPSREYTPVAWGSTASGGWLDLEVFCHDAAPAQPAPGAADVVAGDAGVAGRWAANSALGATVGIGGPRGTVRIAGTPQAWFLAGDESAVAQLRRYAEAIRAGADARIAIEVRDDAHEIPFPAPVTFLHRGDAPAGSALTAYLESLRAGARPAAETFAFIAGERAIVPPARALLLDRWGLDPDRVIVKGYWKAGAPGSRGVHAIVGPSS